MIEKTILNYLNRFIPTYMEMPEKCPDTPFVVLEKTGGKKENHLSKAMIAAQSYGSSLLEAAETNEQVKELMEKSVELDEIIRVSLNSDYNFTDVSAKRYRYQAVFDITHY